MSSSDAQRSSVHHATEDSNLEPSGPNTTATPRQRGEGDAGGGAAGSAGPGAGAAGATRGGDALRQGADLRNKPDDAMGVPGNFERGAAMAGRLPDTDDDANPPGGGNVIGGGPGAGDGSSGGGAGAGIPGGGTDMRTGGAFSGGNPDEDRKRLFPETSGGQQQGHARAGDEADRNNPDESSFGGPLDLDDPDAV